MTTFNKILTSQNGFQKYRSNDSIFKEGDTINGIYFIKQGKVKITKNAKNNIALWFANQHEFIGISSFFKGSEKYSYSTFAFGGAVEALFIPNEDFRSLLDEHPEFKQEIIHVLCDRISSIRTRVTRLKSHSVRQRFLETILFLINLHDFGQGKAQVPYTIDELSELTCASKQYIQKLLKDFQKEKLIEELTDNQMVVDVNKLKTL